MSDRKMSKLKGHAIMYISANTAGLQWSPVRRVQALSRNSGIVQKHVKGEPT